MSDLKSFIERVKSLIAEKIGLDEDIKEVLEEADEAGFDKSAIRKVATIAAKQSALKIAKERAKLDEYAAQIGLDFDMPSGIPGGKSARPLSAERMVKAVQTAEGVQALARTIKPGGSVSLSVPGSGTGFKISKDETGEVHVDSFDKAPVEDANGRAAPRAAGKTEQAPSGAQPVRASRPEQDPASPDPEQIIKAVKTAEGVQALANVIKPGGSVTLQGPQTEFTIRKDEAGEVHIDTRDRSEPPDIPPFLDRRAKGEQTHIEEFTGAAPCA